MTLQVVSPTIQSPAALSSGKRHWIGRSPDCALILDGENVSRRHVSVACTNDGIVVSDSSANGTVVEQSMLRKASRVIAGPSVTLGIGPFVVRAQTSLAPPGRDSARAKAPPDSALPTAAAASAFADARGSIPHPAPSCPIALNRVDRGNPRRLVHKKLLEHLDLDGIVLRSMAPEKLRPRVEAALRRILATEASSLGGLSSEEAVRELADEALGLGPLERLLHDETISEIMVVDPRTIFVERSGCIEKSELRFTDDDSVRAVIERIVTPLGRRIDESTPLVDARLADGSRVNAVIPPLALRGPCITIRKFSTKPLAASDLVRKGSMTSAMARFVHRSVEAKKNILISGGTGSGKTTLLNVLATAVPPHERIVTVEDAAELQLEQQHVVSLESRPPNLEGKGAYTIRDLVRNALRMRPDRIIVGECRGGEAIDMLQAMNTGHEGSLTTIHANSAREAVSRLETLCLMAGIELPSHAIRQQIARSIHLIVQQTRFSDGSRRITSITEVIGIDDDGSVELRELFYFKKHSESANEEVRGEFCSSGYLPTFLAEFITKGLKPEEVFA